MEAEPPACPVRPPTTGGCCGRAEHGAPAVLRMVPYAPPRRWGCCTPKRWLPPTSGRDRSIPTPLFLLYLHQSNINIISDN